MPVYPPGTVVRVRRHLLHPADEAAGLPAAANDAISDLKVVGRTKHAGRDMYVLKHENTDAELYAAKVALQTAVAEPIAAAAAAAAWEGESEEEEEEEDEEREISDDDLFSDYDDEVIVDPPTPLPDAAAPAQAPLIDWGPLGGDLHIDIDGGQRSTRPARMKTAGIDVRGLSPGLLFRLLFPPDVVRSIALATSPRLETPLDVEEVFGFLGLMMRCADERSSAESELTAG